MALQILIKKPTAPNLRQDQWALWMLPITHRPLITMHHTPLGTVLAEIEDSLLAQIALRKLRGRAGSTLQPGDIAFDPSTGIYWLLNDSRTYWMPMGEAYQINLQPLTLGRIEYQSV
jgi:hypothetical protein